MAWIAQNLPTALPIWPNWKFQSFRQPYCSGSAAVALSARADRVLPWMIEGETAEPDYVYLVEKDGSNAVDITDLLTILTGTEGGNDYVYCEASTDIDQGAELTEHTGWNGTTWTTTPGENTWGAFVRCGNDYYLEFKFDSNYYYSEAFTIVDFPEFSTDPTSETLTRVRIEAATSCMIDAIPPLGVQKLFVDNVTAEAEYLVEDSVSEDGNGEKKVLWAKMKKRYHVKFYAVESVMDFCAMLPLYSNVTITDQYGLQSSVSDIDVKGTWGDDGAGCLILIDIAFTRDFAAYTNCC